VGASIVDALQQPSLYAPVMGLVPQTINRSPKTLIESLITDIS
jgi:hypothetical protein